MGTYDVQLTVEDPFGAFDTAVIRVMAAPPCHLAIGPINDAIMIIAGLLDDQVTTGGNQNALSRFMLDAIALINQGDLDGARERILHALNRTDGCGTQPNGNGPGRDWVLDCDAQIQIQGQLQDALNNL